MLYLKHLPILIALLFISTFSYAATSITLEDDTPGFFNILSDSDSTPLVLAGPSAFQIEGNFNDLLFDTLVVAQFEGSSSTPIFHFINDLTSPFVTAVFGPGSYTFAAGGFAKNAYSEFNISVSAVPLPAAIWMFGVAIAGFALFSTNRQV